MINFILLHKEEDTRGKAMNTICVNRQTSRHLPYLTDWDQNVFPRKQEAHKYDQSSK